MSVEAHIKERFARVFVQSDWRLFKHAADLYLERAARMKKADVAYAPKDLQLLVRNAQKRLLIGVGVELLLKAAYLKQSFAINKPQDHEALSFPFRFADAVGIPLKPDDTFTIGRLIDSLSAIVALKELGADVRGLRIAKVFRNKEGHVVTPTHAFEPDDYRAVERSLVAVYRRGFGQSLQVHFSVAWGERSRWVVGTSGDGDGRTNT